MKEWIKAKRKAIIITFSVLLLLLAVVSHYTKGLRELDAGKIISDSLSVIEKVSKLLPIERDLKKEIEVVNNLTEAALKEDNVERSYLVLLQNNMELRPGGGFLGQYAIVKVKNGNVTSTFVEDANLLDQRIEADIEPPYPFRKMMGVGRWKFRDSNFSPDYPTNVEKAKYFYRLAGGGSQFDGVVAVNAQVFADVLKLTGPITVQGYPGEYTSDNAVLKLEEQVERNFEEQGIDVQNRKLILKKMANIIIEKLFTLGNIKKVADFAHEQLGNKNVMLYFNDPELQKQVESVHWDGRIAEDWSGDYFMMVDANLGALKSDYYIKRDISYDIDLTPAKPVVTVNLKYTHTATYGDWRTSDYHSYMRIYAPKGANLLERKMVSYPNIGEEFNKTYFGFIFHALIGRTTEAMIKYELPEAYKQDYRLLVQKQSGVGDVPIKVHMKSEKGEFNHSGVLKKDMQLEFKAQ